MWQIGEMRGWPAPPGRDGESAPRTRTEEGREYGRSLIHLLNWSEHYFGEALALRKFRFHVRTTHVWLQFGQALYSAVCSAKTVDDTRQVIFRFFESPQEMNQRTELRQ
jgi:hypothetical protein